MSTRPHIPAKIAAGLFPVTLSIVFILSAVWAVQISSSIPLYGDTPEYLSLAQGLHVDQYRTVLYPFLLSIMGVVKNGVMSPSIGLIYGFQWLMSVLSVAVFAFAILGAAHLTLIGTHRLMAAFLVSILVVTNPLVAHFSSTLLSDSLATSFTLFFLGSISLSLNAANHRPINIKWFAASVVSLFLMSFIRVEKLYVALLIIIVFITYVVRLRSTQRVTITRLEAIIVVLLLISVLILVAIINRKTQYKNPARPPLDLTSMAFNRVVWPRFSKIYPYLSPEEQSLISYPGAVIFDSNNNSVYVFVSKVYQEPGGRRLIQSITAKTLKHFSLQVAGKTALDTVRYMVPNLMFSLECTDVIKKSGATRWTISRMKVKSARLTDLVLIFSGAMFLLIELPIAIAEARRSRIWTTAQSILLLSGSFIAVNAILFGLESGADTHIRYALPSYVIIQTIVLILCLSWVCRNIGLAGQKRAILS